jgi:hypothetical protein
MKKKVLITVMALVILLGGVMSASAQFRLDVNVQWPFYLGINVSGLTSGVQGTSLISQYAFIVPDVEASYQFGGGNLRAGVGLKAYTFIIESFGWPMAYLELGIDPFVIRAELGGGLFYAFGLASTAATAEVMLPQLEVSWKIAEWFRLGAGALFVMPFNDFSNFGFVGFAGGRFSFVM